MVPEHIHFSETKEDKIRWGRWRLTAVSLIFSLIFLTGCLGMLQGNNNVDLSVSSPYTGAVEVQCTQTCADRGQCGTGVEGTDLVFFNSSRPAVENHDQLITPSSKGVIQQTVTETLQTISTEQQFSQPFHLVLLDGNNVQGWVAEWCVVPTN